MSPLTFIIAFGAAAAVVVGFLRWVWPWIKTGAHVLVAFKNAVLGTEEVTHPDTGKVLVPAQPGLNVRVASIEESQSQIVNALGEIVRTHRRLDDHEDRLGRLEAGAAERTAARTETVELLRVVDTALKTQPPEG